MYKYLISSIENEDRKTDFFCYYYSYIKMYEQNAIIKERFCTHIWEIVYAIVNKNTLFKIISIKNGCWYTYMVKSIPFYERYKKFYIVYSNFILMTKNVNRIR